MEVMFLRSHPQLKHKQQLARKLEQNRSASSRENDALIYLFDASMHPFQTIITTRTTGPILLMGSKIIGEWQISSTRSNNSKPRHTIRYQMTNVPLTPSRKRLTY